MVISTRPPVLMKKQDMSEEEDIEREVITG